MQSCRFLTWALWGRTPACLSYVTGCARCSFSVSVEGEYALVVAAVVAAGVGDVGEPGAVECACDQVADGGAGIGGGPGISVGAALALRGTGRLPVAVCGDGDFLMGVTALWTAVHYNIPLLLVVANNRSFFNDELHQERVARMRGRPVENRWVGQKISEPDIDLAAMARAQGAVGFGPVTAIGDMPGVFEKAIAAVEGGAVAVVDVRVEPGYAPVMTAAMLRKSE